MTMKIIGGTNPCNWILLSSMSQIVELGVHYTPYIPIMLKSEPKYKFSRAKWYEAEYDWLHYYEIHQWCTDMFGQHDRHPDAWSRWNHKYEGRVFFRDEHDYVLFVLRWL